MQTLQQKCYDILTAKNFYTAEKISEFYVAIFELAKQKCNAPDFVCKIGDTQSEDTISYNAEEKTLYIDPCMLKKRHINTVINQIFKTVYLEKQSTEIEHKQLGKSIPVELPLEKTNDYIHYLMSNDSSLNTYALAFTSKDNKQARDFANTETLEFFKQMESLAEKNNATDRQKKFIDIQRQKSYKNIKKEKYQYFDCIKQIDIPKSIYESSFRTIIWEALNKLRSSHIIMNCDQCLPDEKAEAKEKLKEFDIMMQAITQAFCDDFYKNEILFYCKQYEMIEPLYHLFNSPYSSILPKDFNIMFTIAEKQNITVEEITEKLPYWDKETVENLYEKFAEKNKETQEDLYDLF